MNIIIYIYMCVTYMYISIYIYLCNYICIHRLNMVKPAQASITSLLPARC